MASGSTIGFKTDTMVAAGADGTMIALLKRLTTDISGMAGIGDSATGSLTAAADVVTLSTVQGVSYFAAQVSGTYVLTIAFEMTVDGTNWVTVTAMKMPIAITSFGAEGGTYANPSAGSIFVCPCTGAVAVRVRCSAWTSGTASLTLRAVDNGHYARPAAGQTSTGALATVGAVAQNVDTNGHNAFNALVTCALPWLLNASNQFERQRTMFNADGAALGVAACGMMGTDGSVAQALNVDTTGTLRNGKYRVTVSSVPVVGTGTIYTTGDAIGPVTTASGVFRIANGGALLKGLSISNKSGNADIALGIRLYFFNANPSGSTLTDNAAISVVDADIAKIIGYVDIATAVCPGTGTANEVWQANNLDMQLVGASGGTGLHYVLEARGAIAANAGVSDWTVNLHLEQD